MNSKLEELKELYNLSKNKYLYDNIELLENEDIRKETVEITLKLILVDNFYKIFMIVTDNGIVFNSLLEESKEDIREIYFRYLEDVKTLNEKEIFEKYFEQLKKYLQYL